MPEPNEETQKLLVPKEILEKLKMLCLENGMGMMMVQHKTFTFILMGDQELSPDQTCVLAASALLQGVINSAWMEGNHQAKEADEAERSRPN